MKKLGNLLVSTVNRNKRNASSSLEELRRHLSYLRATSEPARLATSPVLATIARQAGWKEVADCSLDWCNRRSDKKQPNHLDTVHNSAREVVRCDHDAWGEDEQGPEKASGGLCRVSNQPGIDYEDSARFAMDKETCGQLCKDGQLREAVEALDLLVHQGSPVATSLLYRFLRRCTLQKDIVLGKRVHALIAKGGYDADTFLANHVICMYASHGMLHEATQVFRRVPSPDGYMWASIILACARLGHPSKAVQLYREMRESKLRPDNRIFVATLKACASAKDLVSGKEVHADFLRTSSELGDLFVGNSLVDMYAKCGSLVDARRVFDNLPARDVVTWNAMIGGYVQLGLGQEALTLYASMQQDGIYPADYVTFVCLLKACTISNSLQQGKQLHLDIQKKRLETDLAIGTCLVEMYAKCGNLEDAREVFDRLPFKDVVTWTVMMAGYVQHELGQEALSLYTSMQQGGIRPNQFTFSCLLKACASVGALHLGKQLHAQIQEKGLDGDVVLGNSLVYMFAKCGCLEDARTVFDKLQTKDVVTWNSMMAGYAQHGLGNEAILLYRNLQQESISASSMVVDKSVGFHVWPQGVQPDGATLTCLLVACSHEGLVDEGRWFFKTMVEDHGIVPTLSHYNCMVDLLGRSGLLDEAEEMLQTMPFENDVVGWTSLLTACKSHGDLDRGTRCFHSLIKLDPKNGTAYSLLAAMYTTAGRWRDAQTVESLRKSAGALKKPAKACIEVKSKVHEFTVGEERPDLSSKLRSMNHRLVEEGSPVPPTEFVQKTVSETGKEDALCGHAEKLALAYGLLNTPDGTTLLVTKNLRMCNDCHIGTKGMSRLEKREIIVRDAHRVHRFVDGSCSCGDRH